MHIPYPCNVCMYLSAIHPEIFHPEICVCMYLGALHSEVCVFVSMYFYLHDVKKTKTIFLLVSAVVIPTKNVPVAY